MARIPQLLSGVRCVWPLGATLGEGAMWSVREQALYFVDILERRLHRYVPAGGERRSWQLDDHISAIAERSGGPGLIVSLRRAIACFDPQSGRLDKLHEPEPERLGNRFNDGKCDAAGRFWAGSMDFACEAASGALYSYEAGGRCVRHLDGIDISNGPTWSADGRRIYFTETGKREISVFDFDPVSGSLSNRRLWLRFGADEGNPDGMTTDAAGRIWIAHWSGSQVSCRDPDTAEVLLRVPMPARQVTNLAFGGPQLRTLYITSAAENLDADLCASTPQGGLFELETDAEGLPANRYAG